MDGAGRSCPRERARPGAGKTMLKKKPVKGSDKVSVTFEVRELPEAKRVGIAGNWNDWDASKTPMRRRKDGAWAATVRFGKGERHEFRYVVDGDRWIADDDADDQVINPYGEFNSVLSLRGPDD